MFIRCLQILRWAEPLTLKGSAAQMQSYAKFITDTCTYIGRQLRHIHICWKSNILTLSLISEANLLTLFAASYQEKRADTQAFTSWPLGVIEPPSLSLSLSSLCHAILMVD